MESAFGVDHGDEVSKGLKDLAQGARLQGKAFTGGFKLARAHRKNALHQAGYPTKAGQNFKESFKAGKSGRAREYRAGQKAATSAGRKRFKADLSDITQGRKPGGRIDPGITDQASARFYRSMSRGEY